MPQLQLNWTPKWKNILLLEGRWLGGHADCGSPDQSDATCTALMRECGLGSFSADQLRQWQRSRIISFGYGIGRY